MLPATEWQGKTGDAWAEEWRRTDRTLAPVNEALLDRAARHDARRILDVGCGAGATSFALADALPNAEVTGLDLSRALVAAAQARIGNRPNTRFVHGDAASWTPEAGPFDLIVSRHGVMFFADPVAAFAHLRSLAPGGRLLFSCFRAQAENEWMTAMLPVIARHAPEALAASSAGPGPFAFADPAFVGAILEGAGWSRPEVAPLDFDFVAGAGDDPLADAIAYFRRIGPMARLLAALETEDAKAAFLADVTEVAAARLRAGKVIFRAAAWIVSSRA